MPGYHIQFSRDTSLRMQKLLKTENNASNIKRIQCVYFRARFNYPAQQIADMVGFSVQTVRDVHSSFIKHGEKALFVKNKGGRMTENMSLKDEEAFLNSKYAVNAENSTLFGKIKLFFISLCNRIRDLFSPQSRNAVLPFHPDSSSIPSAPEDHLSLKKKDNNQLTK